MYSDMVKLVLVIFTILVSGCLSTDETDMTLLFVGNQHITCENISVNGIKSESPNGFKVTPEEAVHIAEKEAGFICSNKLGAQLYADENKYYLGRLTSGMSEEDIIKTSIAIDGKSGEVVRAEFK